jgi:hypothetical protein
MQNRAPPFSLAHAASPHEICQNARYEKIGRSLIMNPLVHFVGYRNDQIA